MDEEMECQVRNHQTDSEKPKPMNVNSSDHAVTPANLIGIDSTLCANENKNGVYEKCINNDARSRLDEVGDKNDEMPEAPEPEHQLHLSQRHPWNRYIGLLMTILSSLVFSVVGLFFKMLQMHHHPLTIASWMFLTTGILSCLYYCVILRWNSRRLQPNDADQVISSWSLLESKQKLIIWARAIGGCSGMLFYFNSLQYISIGDALVITSSSTVFVFLLACVFLKETCKIVPIFTIALALLGVGIILRPPLLTGEESFKNHNLIGGAYGLASMMSIAISIVLMRYLQNVHHSLINLILGWWGSLQTITLAVIAGVLTVPQGMDIISDNGGFLLMTASGLLFFFGQTSLAVALQLEEAGPVSLVRTSEVVFAFIWQIVFLNVFPDIFSLTGAGLIMIGIVTTVVRKWISGLPEDHSARRRLAFILI